MKNLKLSIVEARTEVKALIQILNATISWEFDEEKMAKSFKNYYNNSKGTPDEKKQKATWFINYYSHHYRVTQILNVELNNTQVQELPTMTKRELINAKSNLTRTIKWYINEINWITKDDNNGREISKWYLGKPREPQLRKLRLELAKYEAQRANLDKVKAP